MAANGIGTADVPGLFTVMADPCPVCGKDRVLVGQRHLCAVPLRHELVSTRGLWRDGAAADPANVAMRAEIEALQAEVAALKRDLAKSNNALESMGNLKDKLRDEVEALRVTKSVTNSVTKSDVTKSVTKGRPRLDVVSASAERVRRLREKRKTQK